MADETVAHQPNLMQRKGTFYLRMRVPLDVAEPGGRTHIVTSLKTKERRIAVTRLRLEQARVEREFEAVRRQAAEDGALRRALASGRLEKLSPREIDRLAHCASVKSLGSRPPRSRYVSRSASVHIGSSTEDQRAHQ